MCSKAWRMVLKGQNTFPSSTKNFVKTASSPFSWITADKLRINGRNAIPQRKFPRLQPCWDPSWQRMFWIPSFIPWNHVEDSKPYRNFVKGNMVGKLVIVSKRPISRLHLLNAFAASGAKKSYSGCASMPIRMEWTIFSVPFGSIAYTLNLL